MLTLLHSKHAWCTRCGLESDGLVTVGDDERRRFFCIPYLEILEPGRTCSPARAVSVTPGSLADQYNRENAGRDPIAFFYPYGLPY